MFVCIRDSQPTDYGLSDRGTYWKEILCHPYLLWGSPSLICTAYHGHSGRSVSLTMLRTQLKDNSKEVAIKLWSAVGQASSRKCVQEDQVFLCHWDSDWWFGVKSGVYNSVANFLQPSPHFEQGLPLVPVALYYILPMAILKSGQCRL